MREACLLCRPPTLPLVCLFAPLPRRGRIDPQPPSPAGRGRFFCFLMQGASPLASPALSRRQHLQFLPSECPAGGLPLRCRRAGVSGTLRGACPRRHLLSLPLWCPVRGLAPGVAVSAGVSGTLWGACPLCRPPTLPLAFFYAPYPPNPLPRRGRGRFFSLFRRGLRPRHPCIKPFAALTELAKQVPGGGLAPGGTCYPCRCGVGGGLNPSGTGSPCPGGEDHLKRRRRLRRIVPSPPVPPLLGCRHCSPVPRPNRHATRGHR